MQAPFRFGNENVDDEEYHSPENEKIQLPGDMVLEEDKKSYTEAVKRAKQIARKRFAPFPAVSVSSASMSSVSIGEPIGTSSPRTDDEYEAAVAERHAGIEVGSDD